VYGDLNVLYLQIVDDQSTLKWMYESKDIIRYTEQRFLGEVESR
jgi:hypothetical protein